MKQERNPGMRTSMEFKMLLIILVAACFPLRGSAQGGWDRLPSYDAITIGVSYSTNSNNIPDSTFGMFFGPLTKSVIIPSLAFHSDNKDEYSHYQPSVLLAGDLLWTLNDEVNMSLLTGGIIGNYDRGINVISEPKLRVGAGGTVEDYILVANTYDQGYQMCLGPNVKCDYLLTESLYARFMLKYAFSFYHFVGNNAVNKTLKENAKHPHFFTLDAQIISRWGINLRIEYWKAVSRETPALELSRFWFHCSAGF